MPKLTILVFVILALVAGSLFAGIRTEGGSAGEASTPASSSQRSADRALTGLSPFSSSTSTAAEVAKLEQAVAAHPGDGKSLVLLGYGYQQRWRETADASYLPRSEAALDRALKLDPGDALALTGLGSLALTRHDFRGALALGRRARRLAPFSSRPYGIIGDANLELGRYAAAFSAFERMTALKPSIASYARIAYARELIGHRNAAIAAMTLALDAAGGQPEPSAWTHVELGKLYLARGDLRTAERHFRGALELFPGYVYANDQLARVEAARGHLEKAILLERRVVETVPLPQFVSELADLYERAGHAAQAQRQVSLVRAIDRLLQANGIRTDLEMTVFDADHRIGIATLVSRARAARAERPSILGDDALAWALARTGRCDEARPWSTRAMRLGTQDASLFFHRAEIERCLGNKAGASAWARKALSVNSTFSTRFAPVARRLAVAAAKPGAGPR